VKEKAWEGIAVSRNAPFQKIAWSKTRGPFFHGHIFLSALEYLFRPSTIMTGFIVYENGQPKLNNKNKILTKYDIGLAKLEPQDFHDTRGQVLGFSAFTPFGGSSDIFTVNTTDSKTFGYGYGYGYLIFPTLGFGRKATQLSLFEEDIYNEWQGTEASQKLAWVEYDETAVFGPTSNIKYVLYDLIARKIVSEPVSPLFGPYFSPSFNLCVAARSGPLKVREDCRSYPGYAAGITLIDHNILLGDYGKWKNLIFYFVPDQRVFGRNL